MEKILEEVLAVEKNVDKIIQDARRNMVLSHTKTFHAHLLVMLYIPPDFLRDQLIFSYLKPSLFHIR